jgi:hypothetical protein
MPSNHSVFLRAWTYGNCSANAPWTSTTGLNLAMRLRSTASILLPTLFAVTWHTSLQSAYNDNKSEKGPPVRQGGKDMNRKSCWLDRTTHVIRRLVAATTSAPVPERQLRTASDVLPRMKTNSRVSDVLTPDGSGLRRATRKSVPNSENSRKKIGF